MGYSPQSHEELDTNEATEHAHACPKNVKFSEDKTNEQT